MALSKKEFWEVAAWMRTSPDKQEFKIHDMLIVILEKGRGDIKADIGEINLILQYRCCRVEENSTRNSHTCQVPVIMKP